MGAFGEGHHRGFESGGGSYVLPRRKGGLETPLVGRFSRENTRLVFAPPLWYDGLVLLCILAGLVFSVTNFVGGDGVWAFISLLVFLAGIWGALSNERMVCDLRSRTYARLEGQNFFQKRITKGSMDELDAIVLMAENAPLQGQVIYRLVIYWKGMRQPLLVVERDPQRATPGMPINYRAGRLLQRGSVYAQHMRLPFYDNSHLQGRSPVPVL